MTGAPTQEKQELDWATLLDAALTMPGAVGQEYSRFYNYSWGNIVLLWSQGVEPQPVATYKRWQEVGRHVVKGAKAKEILRPITIKLKDQVDAEGNPKTITKFKAVRAIFPYSDTEGDELPPVEIPGWSLGQALANLGIEDVSFSEFDGNVAGYSYDRKVAVNPVAVNPFKTYYHEIAHIELGHTTPENSAKYQQHRGIYEFGAEGTAYLVANELGHQTEEQASNSRGYIAHWLRGDLPDDRHIREVFKATSTILEAGRLAVDAEAAS